MRERKRRVHPEGNFRKWLSSGAYLFTNLREWMSRCADVGQTFVRFVRSSSIPWISFSRTRIVHPFFSVLAKNYSCFSMSIVSMFMILFALCWAYHYVSFTHANARKPITLTFELKKVAEFYVYFGITCDIAHILKYKTYVQAKINLQKIIIENFWRCATWTKSEKSKK